MEMLLGLAGIAFGGILYFLPAIVAHNRRAATRGIVTVLDIFLGWTVIGWVVALAMAYGPVEK
jgi:Superinfection immunity protein